jgi:hypothetical protein
MIKCEFLGKSGTADKYKVNERYIVYLHEYANCQNLVIDTKDNDKDITQTKKGQDCICVAYCTKNPRWCNDG